MRVEMKKLIEKFGAETEKVFRKQNKKQREKRPLIRKLEDWTTTSNVCLKGFWERETDKTEGCKIFQYAHKMFQNGRMKLPHQKSPLSSQPRGYNRLSPRHVIMKFQNTETFGNQNNFTFLKPTLEARKQYRRSLKTLKSPPRIL